MNGQSLSISNMNTVIANLTSDQFIFLVVHGLTNPDLSSSNSTFNFSFLNVSSTSGLILGSSSKQLAYQVSSTPLNLQIQGLTIDNTKLSVMANYTFTLVTISGSNLTVNSQTTIGINIIFPA